jgi:hypothetical protein
MNGPVVVSATHANPRSMWASLVPEDLQGAAHIVEYVAAEALDEYETFEATRRDAFAAAGADEPSISTIVVDRFVDPESRWQVEITGGVLGDGFVYPPSLVGTTGDIGTQTEEVFEALGRLMGDGAHVVQTVDFTTRATLREYKATGAVRRAHLHPPYPGAAGILMSRLRTRAAKIQLEAVATVLPCAEVNPGWDRYGKLTYRPAVRAGDVLWMAGQFFSFTVVCRSASSHFDAPYVLALVDLDEGVRMLTHIVDADPDTLRCDHPVRVRWVRHPDDADQERPRHLPCFAIKEQ